MNKFYRYPWLIVGIILSITVLFTMQLPRVQIDNNNYRFVPEQEESRKISDKVDRVFGSQVIVLVGIEKKYETILDGDFLKSIQTLEDRLLALPLVDDVGSITGSDYISGNSDGISVDSLVSDDFRGSKEEIEDVKKKLMSWEVYKRGLISDDLRSTQLLVQLKVNSDQAGSMEALETQREIEKIVNEADLGNVNIYMTGMSVISSQMNISSERDLKVLIPAVLLVVMFMLYLSFRKWGGVFIPLVSVMISTIWAIGTMPLFGVKITILSTMLPVILLAVGTAYAIHMVTHYYEDLAKAGPMDKEEHRELVFSILRKVGSPVLMAALTTFAGFISLGFTTVIPIREFGIFASYGVAVALIVALTFVPSLFLIRGPNDTVSGTTSKGVGPGTNGGSKENFSNTVANVFVKIIRKRRTVLISSAVLLAISLIGVSRLIVDNVFVEYFRSDDPIVVSDEFVRENFGGSKTVNVIISAEERGEVLRPDVLAAMDGLSRYVSENISEVGKVSSFTDMIKRTNQVFNADENPEGIKPVSLSPDTGSNFGFDSDSGDEASFGFGSFTQGDGEIIYEGDIEPDEDMSREEMLDSRILVSLLNDAKNSGSSMDIDSRELLENLKKIVNYEGMAYYEIPTDPAKYGKTSEKELQGVIANYLALLSADISAYADDPLEPQSINMNIQLRTIGQIDSDRAISVIRNYADEVFPDDVTVEIGGTALVEETLNRLVVGSQLSSVALSLLFVFLILTIYYKSLAAGLIGLVPLSVSILINFAVMSFSGIKLNIGTALVASIAIGIGIDYTIHYLSSYHREFQASYKSGSGDYLIRTFQSSGKAIIFNALSVGAGFAVLILSKFVMLSYLGALIAITMGTSAFAALTLLPVLLELFKPKFLSRNLSEK